MSAAVTPQPRPQRPAWPLRSGIVEGEQDAVDLIANILESSTEYSIIGKDLDGKILRWNEGARRLYGYEAATSSRAGSNPRPHWRRSRGSR